MTEPGKATFNGKSGTFIDCVGKEIRVGDIVVNGSNTAAKYSGALKFYKVEEFVLTERRGPKRGVDPIDGASVYDYYPWVKFRVRAWTNPGWADRRQQLDSDWMVKVG